MGTRVFFIALRRNDLAAFTSRFGLRKKSTVWVKLRHDLTLIEERLQDIAILMRICYGEDSQTVIRADEISAALQRLKWALETTNVRHWQRAPEIPMTTLGH